MHDHLPYVIFYRFSLLIFQFSPQQSRIKNKLRQVIETESSNVDYTPNVKPSHWRLKKEVPRSAPHINPARSEPDLAGSTRTSRYPVSTPSRHARSPPPTKPVNYLNDLISLFYCNVTF